MYQATDILKQQINDIDIKIKESIELLNSSNDSELQSLAKLEIQNLEYQKKQLEDSIIAIESGMNGNKDTTTGELTSKGTIIMEIRAGTGGDEAGLFANELYNMYLIFSEKMGWKISTLYKSEGGIGNIKELSCEIKGSEHNNPYDLFKYESGVHRVQRIPLTESAGRIHTSTVTVAVLPIVETGQINIRTEDLKIDTYRSTGAGGQHVNTTDSAIRITHLPTGVVVTCQDERSQHKNKAKAMAVLESKLVEIMQSQQKNTIDEIRAEQVGTGERSEKIRTYNFPQDRITDHRTKQSWGNIQKIIEGDANKMLNDIKDYFLNANNSTDKVE
jgi:peptide chain release factor 1